ncbi:MAG TPA: glycosyltransferase [Anaerolineales bacterium]|nr:glycosyltransferase [Anaerolineales bacterium]
MRILITGTTYAPALNGQSIFTTNLAERLVARGHEVTAAFPSDRGEAYRNTRNGVALEHTRSWPLPASIHKNVWVPAPTARDVSGIFDRVQPDILHIQDHYPPTGEMLKQARRRGVRILGTNHYMPENAAPYIPLLPRFKRLFDWLLWKWMLITYNQVELVTAQSKAAAALVRAAGLRPPVFPVSCGIDLRRFRPDPSVDKAAIRLRYGLDPRRLLFLFVGRVDGEKRVDVLVRAMKELNRPDVQLGVAGQGKATDGLMALAKSLDLGDRVQFTGFIPHEDLHRLLNAVDVFTMPSDAELLSIASLEAMACARPVLLANAVALPELVTPGENGYLFKPGDPADAARCMDLLASHPERWADMGHASFLRAQEHSLDKTVSRFEQLYGVPEPVKVPEIQTTVAD